MQENGPTPPPIALSIAVLARDEGALLAPCLAALQWAGELLVVDGGSKDDTCAVARTAGARVIEAPDFYRDNFAARRNLALAEARHPWVLFVDVDEHVSAGLQAEVMAVIAPTNAAGKALPAYAVPRHNVMLGHLLRYGGWWPDLQVRLVRRGAGRYTGLVHEQFVVHTPAGGDMRPPLGYLSSPLTHRTHRSIAEVVHRIDRYSDLQALEWHNAGRPQPALLYLLSRPARHFLRRYVLQQGFRDGSVGLVEALLQAFYVFCCLAKAWELARKGEN